VHGRRRLGPARRGAEHASTARGHARLSALAGPLERGVSRNGGRRGGPASRLEHVELDPACQRPPRQRRWSMLPCLFAGVAPVEPGGVSARSRGPEVPPGSARTCKVPAGGPPSEGPVRCCRPAALATPRPSLVGQPRAAGRNYPVACVAVFDHHDYCPAAGPAPSADEPEFVAVHMIQPAERTGIRKTVIILCEARRVQFRCGV